MSSDLYCKIGFTLLLGMVTLAVQWQVLRFISLKSSSYRRSCIATWFALLLCFLAIFSSFALSDIARFAVLLGASSVAVIVYLRYEISSLKIWSRSKIRFIVLALFFLGSFFFLSLNGSPLALAYAVVVGIHLHHLRSTYQQTALILDDIQGVKLRLLSYMAAEEMEQHPKQRRDFKHGGL